MEKQYTGIFARTLVMSDMDTSQFEQAVTAGVPVRLYYQVLPGNELSWGAGSTSLGGVRSARLIQLSIKNSAGTPVEIPCKYRLMYQDSNRVQTTVVREDLTTNVSTAPNAYDSDAAAQNAFLPEILLN